MLLRGVRPLRELLLLSLLAAAVVNAGNMVAVDGKRRLQVAHWLWLGEAPVLPEDAPVFGNRGKDGRLHAWYGLGHSLWMLPFDVVSHGALAAAGSLIPLQESTRRQADVVLVAWMSQSALLFLALAAARGLLLRLEFRPAAASAGVLILLFGTSLLHYVQNCQENLLILTCDLWAFLSILRWRERHCRSDALRAGAAAGFAILTRLSAALDLAALLLFAFLLAGRQALRLVWQALPSFLVFALIERYYNFHRFGDWLGAYVPNVRDVSTGSAALVFNRSFSRGFFGALFAPDVSIFLFDPLLVLALVLLAVGWVRLPGSVRAYAVALLALLLGQISLYARFLSYSGEIAWGDRYVAATVEMLALLAAPLAVSRWSAMRKPGKAAVAACVLAAVLVQISSVMVMLGVEEIQMKHEGRAVFAVLRRWTNIWLVWSGAAEGHPLFVNVPREWTRPSLLPFQLEFRHQALYKPAIAAWVVLLVLTVLAAIRAAAAGFSLPRGSPQKARNSSP